MAPRIQPHALPPFLACSDRTPWPKLLPASGANAAKGPVDTSTWAPVGGRRSGRFPPDGVRSLARGSGYRPERRGAGLAAKPVAKPVGDCEASAVGTARLGPVSSSLPEATSASRLP